MHLLERMVEIGLQIGTLAILLYVVIGRIWFSKRRGRYWTASSVGNALQQLQSIARPSIQYQIEEKQKERAEEDDEGAPKDPATYYRRLRERIDQRRGDGAR